MPTYNLTINSQTHTVEVDADTPLLWVLRDHINLVGTKYGCGIGQCGSCTVHVEGNAVRSCMLQVSQLVGMNITTIEGLAEDNKLHPVQEAFKENHGLQCGFCTPGMVMSAIDLLKIKKNPSDQEIREWLEGNICRCTGYQNIVAAVKEAATKM